MKETNGWAWPQKQISRDRNSNRRMDLCRLDAALDDLTRARYYRNLGQPRIWRPLLWEVQTRVWEVLHEDPLWSELQNGDPGFEEVPTQSAEALDRLTGDGIESLAAELYGDVEEEVAEVGG